LCSEGEGKRTMRLSRLFLVHILRIRGLSRLLHSPPHKPEIPIDRVAVAGCCYSNGDDDDDGWANGWLVSCWLVSCRRLLDCCLVGLWCGWRVVGWFVVGSWLVGYLSVVA
jgi:hypothetical protein